MSSCLHRLLVGGGIALVLLSASCARFAPNERGADQLAVPSEFTLYENTVPPLDDWWKAFGAEEMTQFVTRALDGNLTIQQVLARLTQAETIARQAGALRWPTLTATGDVSSTLRHTDATPPSDPLGETSQKLGAVNTLLANAGGAGTGTGLDRARSDLEAVGTLLSRPKSFDHTTTTHSYRFGLGSTYEVDLWGRVRAQHEAALLDLEASREDVYAAMLSLSGTVVREWLTAVAYRQELALVEKQLALNKTRVELMELRHRKGMATALDVYQQRQIIAQTESLIPPLESALQTSQHELAVLLGAPPRSGVRIDADTLPTPPALPAPGVPADLLARRPDVRAMGLQLRAAEWRVAAARADRLPALRLTGSASYGAEEWDILFDNWLAALAGSLAGPLFDGGRRKSEVERTRAVVSERLAAYHARVLEAVKEVENALFQEAKQAEYLDALNRELEAARASHQQALIRYQNGLNDYLPVLSALSQLQVLERRLVQAELNRLTLRVQLCVALGGGWMAERLDDMRGSPNAASNERAGGKERT